MSVEFHFSPNVAIEVSDRARAVALYRDVLGFEVVKEGKRETKLQKGPMTFFVGGVEGAGATYWEFRVDDFKAARVALLAAGCTETKCYAPTSAMFADPFGLRFHVYETGTDLPDCA